MAGRVMGVAAAAALLFLTAIPDWGVAQRLVLSTDVGKAEFFEDEPIYLLVRLKNIGTDTAWVAPFGLVEPAVTLSLRRGDGSPVPVNRAIGNFVALGPWRGEPVPPSASRLNTQVLQNLVGEEQDYRNHAFKNNLSPGQYELRVTFHAHAGLPRTMPLTLEAASIAFEIRKRTVAEENEVKELEAMRGMSWDTVRAAGYRMVLIDWVERRLHDQPDDPFLPFLLYEGLYSGRQIVPGKAPRFDPDTSEVVSRLRLAVIDRHRLSTAGAHLVQGLTARHPDQLAILAEELGATPGGEMARYQVERNQHAKQFRNQPPR